MKRVIVQEESEGDQKKVHVHVEGITDFLEVLRLINAGMMCCLTAGPPKSKEEPRIKLVGADAAPFFKRNGG